MDTTQLEYLLLSKGSRVYRQISELRHRCHTQSVLPLSDEEKCCLSPMKKNKISFLLTPLLAGLTSNIIFAMNPDPHGPQPDDQSIQHVVLTSGGVRMCLQL